jgi:uncharacterized membrane protein YgdD (TMEM256/DUF423 family)
MNQRTTLLFGAVFGGLGIALGAFGAHALKPILLANNKLDAYEIAVRYQVYHAFALILAGLLMGQVPQTARLRWGAICWVIGIILFSGSLYALSLSSITAFAFLTPLGGLFFLSGWVFLSGSILKNK